MDNDELLPLVAGRRRSRGTNTSVRKEALERLKTIRTSGRRENGGFQVKLEEPVYDTIDEDEYDALKAKRREEVKGFIVDDDGLGYADDGQEEDWTKRGLPVSSDESDEERSGRTKKKKTTEKKDPPPKKPSPLIAAAALMGKQRLSNMFTSSNFKNKDEKAKNFSCDSIVDDVLAEFAPDETDRERRRKAHTNKSNSRCANIMTPIKTDKTIIANLNGESLIFNDEKIEQVMEKDTSRVLVSEEPLNACEFSPKRSVEEENTSNDVEKNVESAKVESPKKKEDGFVLNAKIKEKTDSAFSATSGWQEVRNAGNASGVEDRVDLHSSSISEEKQDFFVESDGSMPFYLLDAHEEFYGANTGTIYLFGKVKTGSTYQSCCVVVKNMKRCLYAIPTCSLIQNEKVLKLEKDLEESRISMAAFRTQLLEIASELKTEVQNQLIDCNVSSFSMTPVKRSYAFERSDIPSGENYALKINYPFKYPPLPADLKGENFSALLGTHTSPLELFLIKRKIMGPSWLSIKKFSSCPSPQRVSWCKFEVIVDCPKDVQNSSTTKNTMEIPPVVVTALNLKTILNEKQNVNEIVSASIICCQKSKIDSPSLASEWTRPGMIRHFSVVRKLDGSIFPMGFTKHVDERNTKARSVVICTESSERALLNRLLIELHKLDSDVLVGHNISGFDLDVLLHRAQACRVPSTMWSKIGRLKRSMMPKLKKGNSIFGSGASPGIMSCIAGRLLCDTFLCSRDLLKEVSYSLTQLAKNQLNKERKEIAPHEVHLMFQSSESLMELIECNETDAWLSMELMFHLSVLPLTRQLTKISGNLWGKTLQGARAQRVEYLLLHAFHGKKYILPDKLSYHPKEEKVLKRKVKDGAETNETDDINVDDGHLENDHVKSKKGPAYSGGLVLEPKRGLYDKYILLLDFNSLYPSIIQEYNICFTTVERSQEGSAPSLPTSKKFGVLPELLRNLVDRRKTVKALLKKASGLEAQQFDIQQQALKLTANSMYGCLGFSSSRFYAKPLAELITLQGREILQSTVDLVQNNLNLEVIYGDTDSIMIYSGLDDVAKARAISDKVIQEVNKKYRCLEIDLDGLYKRMLLLKKKKYAAVKLQFKDGKPYEVIERKGLDMVRRDWSMLSKELGDFCLSQILSGGTCEDVVESIHNALRKVQEEMRNGQISLEKYVITKSLTKPPEAYPDAKNQPHVEVALRLKKNGYTAGCSAGDTVPYVICCEQGTTTSGNSVGIAQRARHPDELKQDNGKWIIDINYYLAQQIHPVVSRLCASIQGTSPAHLADCLGLDSSKFQGRSNEAVNNDPSPSLICSLDDDDRYRDCEPLVLSCPSCSGSFECPTIFSSVCSIIKQQELTDPKTEEEPSNSFWHKLRCTKCPGEGDMGIISPASIANQVKRQAEGFVSTYYKGLMVCDDETCKYTTRSLNLRVIGDSERGTICPNYPLCNGRLTRKYTEADLYKQLSCFCHVLDTANCINKAEKNSKILIENEIRRIKPLVDLAFTTVQKMRDRCSYGWVQMKDLIVTI
ncbi:DNA polymerase alpha catalytic subunit [Impatiens glandulifera]|uniref:DNA polymerase alpha catalytic subunit n=1 Tax=Impatiens glandulifera TaxID=253017 RepID=UPI001FB11305|nr:DNA polymerase alpha catalytic subunit [Impatiens glandulifera]